ncbi:hypothetical protein H0H93_015785 [Arthromyces matolae]|nr:hypothetical protein H0H93_015785 [Arthromyces matolae]
MIGGYLAYGPFSSVAATLLAIAVFLSILVHFNTLIALWTSILDLIMQKDAPQPQDLTTLALDVNMASTDVKSTTDGALHTGLPFPKIDAEGKLVKDGDGNVVVDFRRVEGVTKNVLTGLCREFKIPHSHANVSELRKRLIAFSSSEDEWEYNLSPGARRNHRGPRDGSKSAPLKQSYKRQLDLFSSDVAPSSILTVSSKSTTFVRTEEEKNGIISWAKRFANANPYKDPDSVDVVVESTSGIGSVLSEQSILQLAATVSQLCQAVTTNGSSSLVPPVLTSQPPLLSPHPSSSLIPPPPPSQPTLLAPHQSFLPNEPLSLDSDIVMSESPCSEPLHKLPQATRTLQLGNGIILTLTKDGIPEPPTTSFTNDVLRLNAMWDDKSSHWQGKSDLTIAGHPIALVYWRDVYSYWLPQYWTSIKTRWSEWRLVVSYYRMSDRTAFEAIFLDNEGKFLKWKQLHSRCVLDRQERDRHLAARAREEFGDQFSSAFTYRQGNKHGLAVEKVSSIARRYRKMKGIVDLIADGY